MIEYIVTEQLANLVSVYYKLKEQKVSQKNKNKKHAGYIR